MVYLLYLCFIVVKLRRGLAVHCSYSKRGGVCLLSVLKFIYFCMVKGFFFFHVGMFLSSLFFYFVYKMELQGGYTLDECCAWFSMYSFRVY